MFITWTLSCLCLVQLRLLTSAEGIQSNRLNVLFIVIDDLRPALGCFDGRFLTPNIDQLAENSLKFTRAHVQQAICAPSRISFLTSRRPDTTKLYNFDYYWRTFAGNYTTLPQHFKESGYYTTSVGKIFHPGKTSNHNDDYPYSWSVPAYHPPTQKYKQAKVCENPDGTLHTNLICPVDVDKMPGGSLPDIQSADYAIQIIKNISKHANTSNDLKAKQPFFLAVGFHKPHVPYKYPKEYQKLYPLETMWLPPNNFYPPDLPPVAWDSYDSLRKRDDFMTWNVSYPYGPIPLHYQRLIRQNYFAATTYMDYEVGRVLSELGKSGFINNTIISFVGDHGWQLGEHDEWAKFSNFKVATNVPMFVYIPGVTTKKNSNLSESFFPLINPITNTKLKQEHLKRLMEKKNQKRIPHSGFTSDAFAELVDLFPTLSELAGLKVPPTCPPYPFKIQFCTEGTSLVPVIKNVTDGDKTIIQWKNATFSQYPRPQDDPCPLTDLSPLVNITIMGYSMHTDKYRYTEWIGFDHVTFKQDWNNVHAKELYILENDEEENYNVANKDKYEDLVKELSQVLKCGWRYSLPVLQK